MYSGFFHCQAIYIYPWLIAELNYNNDQSSDISNQVMHLSSQTKFGEKNLQYIINGKLLSLQKKNECLDNFQSLSQALFLIHT